jgi:hypothetical protein
MENTSSEIEQGHINNDSKILEEEEEDAFKSFQFLNRFESVTMTTVNRWREKGKVNLECFYGFNEGATIEEKNKAAEMLQAKGYFHCKLCDEFIKGNKKSIFRHQGRNRKHKETLMRLQDEGITIYGPIKFDTQTTTDYYSGENRPVKTARISTIHGKINNNN